MHPAFWYGIGGSGDKKITLPAGSTPADAERLAAEMGIGRTPALEKRLADARRSLEIEVDYYS